ncbi:hypothetical protein V1289_010027 [Bradyrhizobium sp. AZCC 2289]
MLQISNISSRSRGATRPKFCTNPSLEEGAGNARCALHPRSRVQSAQKKTHTSIQVQRRHSGIPRAMVLRLMPCSPRRRIRLVTVAAGLMAGRSGRSVSATGSLTPATGARTTRFYRTQQPVFAKRLYGLWRRSSCAPMLAHGQTALRTFACRRCRVHRISTRVRDDRDPPLVWVRRAD